MTLSARGPSDLQASHGLACPAARSWVTVTLAVLAAQAVFIGAYFARGKSAVDFARVAPQFVKKSHRSTVIVPSRFGFTPHEVGRGADQLGYDGQFYLFMALDPANARYYLDDPPYRLQRPLYSAVSRLIAGGDAALVPVAMLLVNWLAAGAGTAIVARLLVRRRRSAWFALLYGLAPGLTLGVHRDLTEPLAFALLAAAIAVLGRRRPRSPLYAGLLFGLAGLTREASIVFPIVFAAWRAWADRGRGGRERWLPAAAILLLGVVPYLSWIVFERAWLGMWPWWELPSFVQPVPFEYLFDQSWALSRQPEVILGVVVPTLMWVGVIVAMRAHLTPALVTALVSVLRSVCG